MKTVFFPSLHKLYAYKIANTENYINLGNFQVQPFLKYIKAAYC